RHAVATASALERDLLAAEAQNAQAMQRTADRIKALESALAKAPGDTPGSSAEQRLVDRATECVLAHIGQNSFGPGDLAAELAVSEKTLGRRLKGALDLTPAAFIRKVRLSFARDLVLLRQYETVAEVAYAAGFASVSHFSKLYREEFGETPKATLKPAKPRAETGAEPGTAEPRR
ncbi:MAG: helix-turn-helix domain-containing protein, partial [Pseudomonadota bacterium]